MQILSKYFPELTSPQLATFELAEKLYQEWNNKINLISRQDTQNIETHHFLHSLLINKIISFKANSQVLDFGTGGGFPGIPLAITNSLAEFKLVDSIQKKIKVVEDVIQKLNLKNVSATKSRVEEIDQQFDYIVVRAVSDLKTLWKYSQKLLKAEGKLICLKGGDRIHTEIAMLSKEINHRLVPLSNYIDLEYFKQKYCVIIKQG